MDEVKKQELYNLFKLVFASMVNKDKYSSVQSYEELNKLLENNPEDKEKIEASLASYTDDQLLEMASKLQEEEKPISAKKGTYLKKLNLHKKGAKCSCGCKMVISKEAGGKMISKCACGCSTKK